MKNQDSPVAPIEMKTLILDYATWRSGGDEELVLVDPESKKVVVNPNIVGEGPTCLRNELGFGCCLGQFTPQIDKTIDVRELLNVGETSELARSIHREIPFLTYINSRSIWFNTDLAKDAMYINDNPHRTPDQRIEALTTLFAKHGFKIQVINK